MPAYLRCTSLVLASVCFVPNFVNAAPIVDFESAIEGGVLIVHGQHSLLWEDIQILMAQGDHGWHLGWFKDKADINAPSTPGSSTNPWVPAAPGTVASTPTTSGVAS